MPKAQYDARQSRIAIIVKRYSKITYEFFDRLGPRGYTANIPIPKEKHNVKGRKKIYQS